MSPVCTVVLPTFCLPVHSRVEGAEHTCRSGMRLLMCTLIVPRHNAVRLRQEEAALSTSGDPIRTVPRQTSCVLPMGAPAARASCIGCRCGFCPTHAVALSTLRGCTHLCSAIKFSLMIITDDNRLRLVYKMHLLLEAAALQTVARLF